MSDTPWYPWFPGDCARDTAHLSLTEQGVYRVLLDHYYSTRKPLPANDEQLLRICRAFASHERDAVQSIMPQFFRLDGDVWRNRRADHELQRQAEISAARSTAGKQGGKSKAKAKQTGSKQEASEKQSPSKDDANAPNGSGCGSGSGSPCQEGDSYSVPEDTHEGGTGDEEWEDLREVFQ